MLFLAGCVSFPSDTVSEQPLAEGMTFEVSIPNNTPSGDTVYIYFKDKYQLENVGEFLYRRTFTEEELQPEQGEIRYRYSRNGYDFHTAEYLAPTAEEPQRDTNDFFWTERGRKATFQPGNVQKDKIARWRWFPEEGLPVKTTALQPDTSFLPRINNMPFRSGQTIEDLYADAYPEFFSATAQHLKTQGYRWVELDPPWQWVEEQGLPRIRNEAGSNPNYPDDETFLAEIKAYTQEGLAVMIAPQVCCTPLTTENRTKEWWDTYFEETGKFLIHFAKLAEQEHADAFMYAVPSWINYPSFVDVDAEWRAIFSALRPVFSGEIGQMVWILGPDVSPTPSLIPDTSFITWGDELDFFLVSTEFPLSLSDAPTDEELVEGAERVLSGVKPLYDVFHKPVMLRNGYFNVKHTWKGQTLYDISSVPWISEPEAALAESKYIFNAEDHARVVHAYFRAIAQNPWVSGYFHFGYTHWEDPLSPWMSVRGKPAEDIWRKWNEVIYEQ